MTNLRIYSVSIALAVISMNIASAQNFNTGIPVIRGGNNQIVGPLIDIAALDATTTVFVDDVPYPLVLSLDGSLQGVRGNFPTLLFFGTNDCSGTPHVNDETQFTPPFFAATEPNLTIWVPAQGATSILLSTGTTLNYAGICSFFFNPFPLEVIEAVAVGTSFIPPYTAGRGPSVVRASLALGIPTLGSSGQKLLLLGMLAAGFIALYRRRPQGR